MNEECWHSLQQRQLSADDFSFLEMWADIEPVFSYRKKCLAIAGLMRQWVERTMREYPGAHCDEMKRAMKTIEDNVDDVVASKQLPAAVEFLFPDFHQRHDYHLLHPRLAMERGKIAQFFFAFRIMECDRHRGSVPELHAEYILQFLRGEHAGLMKELLGNPFCPEEKKIPASSLTWNNSTAAKIARVIYNDQQFDRLPILADALEDAGCDNAAMLEHLRGPDDHVRGCWALDAILHLP